MPGQIGNRRETHQVVETLQIRFASRESIERNPRGGASGTRRDDPIDSAENPLQGIGNVPTVSKRVNIIRAGQGISDRQANPDIVTELSSKT